MNESVHNVVITRLKVLENVNPELEIEMIWVACWKVGSKWEVDILIVCV
jgi:hypothetical protein